MIVCGKVKFIKVQRSKTMKSFLVGIALTLLIPVAANGQTMDHSKMMHDKPMAGDLPKETGQSAFAAIQEIVDKLSADPATDWSKVDIEALRQHLIDMNNVTLGAVVDAKHSDSSTTFVVSGDGPVRNSIRRMVVAHAATRNGLDGWKITAEATDTGAVLTITPPDPAAMIKLRAIGFIGFMTLGMHHQEHHWMLAKGMSPHN
jgi:hypothetical protein